MLKFGFYNSSQGDRKYDATDFSEIIDSIMDDGVVKGFGTEFAITATGGLATVVGVGHSWFNETYLNNTENYPITLDASEVALNRIDAYVLEFNKSDSVRANTIRVIKGQPAAVPVKPTLTMTETLKQYPIGWVYRAAGSTSITQANITKGVGTPECPYAVSRLLDRSFEPPISHRQVFRGKFLGTAYTQAQKTAVQSGSFEDLYIGDYWTIGGQNWRIVDIDYYYGKGDLPVTKHHILLMPDRALRSGKMNTDSSKANSGAYAGADARSQVLTLLYTQINDIFGTDKFEWRQLITSSMSNGKPDGFRWSSSTVEIPNQLMLIGTQLFQSDQIDYNLPANMRTESTAQLALFRLAPWFLIPAAGGAGSGFWTRDVLGPLMWAAVGSYGEMTYLPATTIAGFRPIFGLS